MQLSKQIEQQMKTSSRCQPMKSKRRHVQQEKNFRPATQSNPVQWSTNTICHRSTSIRSKTNRSIRNLDFHVLSSSVNTPWPMNFGKCDESAMTNSIFSFRRRTGAPTDEQDDEEIPETMSTSTDPSLSTLDMDYRSSNRSNEGFALKLLIIIFLLTPFFLGPFLQSGWRHSSHFFRFWSFSFVVIGQNNRHSTLHHRQTQMKMRRLSGRSSRNWPNRCVSSLALCIDDRPSRVSFQIEEKFRILSNEKSMLLSQINDLYHLLNFTQESALNHINQVISIHWTCVDEKFLLVNRGEQTIERGNFCIETSSRRTWASKFSWKRKTRMP